MKHVLNLITSTIKSAPEHFQRLLDTARERLEQLWEWHCDRLRNSPAYRSAIAGGATAVMAEVALGPVAAAVLTAVVGAYAAAYATQTSTSSRWGYDPTFDDGGYDRF